MLIYDISISLILFTHTLDFIFFYYIYIYVYKFPNFFIQNSIFQFKTVLLTVIFGNLEEFNIFFEILMP
jgi:hypothetical protein